MFILLIMLKIGVLCCQQVIIAYARQRNGIKKKELWYQKKSRNNNAIFNCMQAISNETKVTKMSQFTACFMFILLVIQQKMSAARRLIWLICWRPRGKKITVFAFCKPHSPLCFDAKLTSISRFYNHILPAGMRTCCVQTNYLHSVYHTFFAPIRRNTGKKIKIKNSTDLYKCVTHTHTYWLLDCSESENCTPILGGQFVQI